jgi:hypothetical protein
MYQIRPSLCRTTGRDTVDSILDALAEIVPRPMWLLRSAVLPACVVAGIGFIQNQSFASDWGEAIWWISLTWLLQAVAFIPCVLAWSRIGFCSAADAPAFRLSSYRGVLRGLDLIAICLLTVFALAVSVDLALRAATETGEAVFPARWVLVFAAAVVIMPTLILGGMRLLITLPAAALGWHMSYADALLLTRERSGWLAGIGVAFVCMFPLTWQGVAGLRGVAVANFPSIPDVVWPWVSFLSTVLLCAVAGHGLGQVLRRLLDGIPEEEDGETQDLAL